MLAVVVVGFFVCSLGLQKGVERITKVMMACLFVILMVLCVRSVTLPGAAAGLEFLPCTRFWKDVPRRHCGGKNGANFGQAVCRHGAGVLHAQPRHQRHGYFRLVYRQGSAASPARP